MKPNNEMTVNEAEQRDFEIIYKNDQEEDGEVL